MTLILLIALSVFDNSALSADRNTESIGLRLENLAFDRYFATSGILDNYLINISGEYAERPTGLIYVFEGIVGHLTGLGAGLIMGLPAILSSSDGGDVSPFYISLPIAGVIVGSPFGINFAGKIMKQRGSFKKSIIGATAGMVIGVIIGYTELSQKSKPLNIPAVVGTCVTIPTICAVLLYNW